MADARERQRQQIDLHLTTIERGITALRIALDLEAGS
jgi:hypothetical protein